MSVRGLSPPTAPAALSVSSYHILAERRGVIKLHGSRPVPSGLSRDNVVRTKAFRLPRCCDRGTRQGGHAGVLCGCPVGPLHGARCQSIYGDG